MKINEIITEGSGIKYYNSSIKPVKYSPAIRSRRQ